MTLIPDGWFWMGSNRYYDWERPKHRVFLDAFEIATTTVTRREYARFMEASGRERPRAWADPAFADPDQPVVGVSWFDVTAYCEWLSRLTGERYRLPTEAEWEKACKGGSDVDYAWGEELPESFEYFQGAWPAPRRVAEWRPNGYGLFNMGENVHEWCLDWYAPDYYVVSPSHNPYGPESGQRRISRGGSWRHAIKASRAAHRSSLLPEYRYTDYGFRVIRSDR
jgi:formylglycine-generating enzyme required for sulfatase activity